jgi:hypothetical protein
MRHDPDLQFLIEWLERTAFTISGIRGVIRLRFGTWQYAYNNYLQFCHRENCDSLGIEAWKEYLRSWCIRPIDYTAFVCPYCHSI